jgi:hypothetical protein
VEAELHKGTDMTIDEEKDLVWCAVFLLALHARLSNGNATENCIETAERIADKATPLLQSKLASMEHDNGEKP